MNAINLSALGHADLLISIISGQTPDEMIEDAVAECLRRMSGAVADVAPVKVARKPRKAAAGDVAPSAADIMKANAKMRRDAAKQSPAMIWGGCAIEGANGAMWPAGNPMREARKLALAAQGWVPGDDMVDGYMIWRKAGEIIRLGHHGMIYMGMSGWWQMSREERDDLTDAGKPMLEAQQRRSTALDALVTAKAKRAAAVKRMGAARLRAGSSPAYAYMIADAKREAGAAWRAMAEARALLRAA